MLCTNCYRKIKDNSETCPHCNAPIDKTIMRCPECWNKLPIDAKVCDKCGCDIERSIKEKEELLSYREPTALDKLKALPKKVKTGIIATLVIIALAGTVCGVISSANRKENLRVLTAEYTLLTENAINAISEIAAHYENDVYTKDWITYIESAQKLREEYKEEIDEIKKFREPVSHRRNKIKAVGDSKAGRLADRIYYCYSNCYGYVIGEIGKYPNYLKKYNMLVDEYQKAVDELAEYVR